MAKVYSPLLTFLHFCVLWLSPNKLLSFSFPSVVTGESVPLMAYYDPCDAEYRLSLPLLRPPVCRCTSFKFISSPLARQGMSLLSVYCISKRIQQMMSISSWLFCLIYWKMCQPIWVCQPSLQFKHPTDMKLASALLKIEFQRKTLLLESTWFWKNPQNSKHRGHG